MRYIESLVAKCFAAGLLLGPVFAVALFSAIFLLTLTAIGNAAFVLLG